MKRRLFTVLSLLSLLLCAALAGVWVRSYFVMDLIGTSRVKNVADTQELRQWSVSSNRGHVQFFRQHYLDVHPMFARDPGESGNPLHHWTQPTIDNDVYLGTRSFRLLGFVWRNSSRSGDGSIWHHTTHAAVPTWAPCAATGAPFAWLLFRGWRRSRRGPHACPACGYDLRATPERCPECGAVAATDAKPTAK